MNDKTITLFNMIKTRNDTIAKLQAERNNIELRAIYEGNYTDWVSFNNDYIEWERTLNR